MPDVEELVHDAGGYTGLYSFTPEETKAQVLAQIEEIRDGYESGATEVAHDFRAVSGVPQFPTLASISPNTKAADAASFTLTATGTEFAPTSVINWGGVERATTFVNSTTLTATVPGSATPATVPVFVTSGQNKVTATLQFSFT